MSDKECPTCGTELHDYVVKTLKKGKTDGIRVVLKIQPNGAAPFLCAVGSDAEGGRVSVAAIDVRFCPTCGRRLGVEYVEPPRAETAKKCSFPIGKAGTLPVSKYCTDDCALRINSKCAFRVIAERMC